MEVASYIEMGREHWERAQRQHWHYLGLLNSFLSSVTAI